MPYYHVNDDLSKAWNVNNDLDWLVMNYFYELVDDDEDWIIVVFFSICQNWQTYNKINQ